MKTRAEVTAEKLRGGFYSPDGLVDLCLDRVAALIEDREALSVLEPSAGDGAFIRGLARHPLGERVEHVAAVELSVDEAAKCRHALDAAPFAGDVVADSAIAWALGQAPTYDVAVGNPPFVRFQFVDEDNKLATARLATSLSLPLRAVGNLWIPVLLGALTRLLPGGAFSFIVPAECFTGSSAGVVRQWLVTHVDQLRFDLFPPNSFPGVLQEVVILSGVHVPHARHGGPASVEIHDNARGRDQGWSHVVDVSSGPWTKLLLTPAQLAAVSEAAELPSVVRLSELAKFEVAAVTGANDYFSVSNALVDQYALEPWAVPLLPRVRHAHGLRYKPDDHRLTVAAGAKAYLLDFSSEKPDPTARLLSARYIESGEVLALHERYKCRIRTPWYRVPFIRTGAMMLSKRSHLFPRVILNEASVVTTDTIYRGALTARAGIGADDFVSAFHNSLTLLAAEMEGRSFGGGVLELVPSEVSRLLVPALPGFGVELERLDSIARAQRDPEASDDLIDETDRLLAKADVGLTIDLLARLRDARDTLLRRRLDRTGSQRNSAPSR